MMNSEPLPSPSIPTSSPSTPNGALDKLSYKELQALAMSINLPGKMKQGVLVEAIRARQNQNEVAVAMILEANRQRKFMKRHEQQQLQQQQLMRLNAERGAQLLNNTNSINTTTNNSSNNNSSNNNNNISRRKCPFPRPRMKRPASEMESETCLNDDDLKRSKLVAALTQYRRPAFFNHAPAGFNQRKEHSASGTWDPPMHRRQHVPIVEQTAAGPILAVQQHTLQTGHRPLPDLSKDLSILPALNDCSSSSNTLLPPPPTSSSSCDDVGSCSSVPSAASWTGLQNNPDQAIPNGTFDGCDPGWLGSSNEEPYDGNNSWTKLARVGPNCNGVTCATLSNSDYGNVPPATVNHESNVANQPSAGYYAEQSNVFNNGGTNPEGAYRPDDFMTGTPAGGSSFADFVPQTPAECCQAVHQKLNSNWSNPTPSQLNHQAIHHHHHQQQQLSTPLPIAVMTSRLWFDCYDANCYHKNAPLFRIQRPGNPSSLFVPSGRSFTLPTFCNMHPRVASFIQ